MRAIIMRSGDWMRVEKRDCRLGRALHIFKTTHDRITSTLLMSLNVVVLARRLAVMWLIALLGLALESTLREGVSAT